MPGLKIHDCVTNTTTTLGGASATILSSTPPVGINTIAIIEVIARCNATDDRAYWTVGAFFNSTNAGVLTVDRIDDIVAAWSTNPIKQADIDLVVSGGTVNLVVTGDPGFAVQPLEWQALAEFWRT